MKRDTRFNRFLVATVFLSSLGPVIAQTNPKLDNEQQTGVESDPSSATAEAGAGKATPWSARRFAAGPRNRRPVARVRKLHEEMIKKLDLTSEQRVAIDNLMEEFSQTARKPAAKRNAPRADRSEMRQLRQQMTEARKRGDKEVVDSLRREWSQLALRQPRRGDSVTTLIMDIENVLVDSQRSTFRELLRRLKLQGTVGARTGGLGAILRATRHPSLELTDEQQTTVSRIVREEMLAIPKEQRRTAAMNAVLLTVRERIMQELTPTQQSQFRSLLDDEDTVQLPESSKPVAEDADEANSKTGTVESDTPPRPEGPDAD